MIFSGWNLGEVPSMLANVHYDILEPRRGSINQEMKCKTPQGREIYYIMFPFGAFPTSP